jgi:hypothetical protein
VALALATLVKFYPILLVPVFLNASANETSNGTPRDVKSSYSNVARLIKRVANRANLSLLAAFVTTVVLAYLPYVGAGGNLFGFLQRYIQEEGFTQTGARYFLLETLRTLIPISTSVFLLLAGACFIGFAAWWLVRTKQGAVDLARGASVLIGVYLVLTTPRYAWYYAWIIPFLCFVPRISWLHLTSASTLLYLLWYTPLVYPEIPLWLGFGIYVPTIAWLARELLKPAGKRQQA